MKNLALIFLMIGSLAFSSSAFSGAEEELNRFDMLCKTDADVVVNGHQFKKSGLSFASIVDTIKQAFSGKSQNSQASGNDALYLINVAYTLKVTENEALIREAAYRLCMKEKLSTDRT